MFYNDVRIRPDNFLGFAYYVPNYSHMIIEDRWDTTDIRSSWFDIFLSPRLEITYRGGHRL